MVFVWVIVFLVDHEKGVRDQWGTMVKVGDREGLCRPFARYKTRLFSAQNVMVDGSTGQAFTHEVKRLLDAGVEEAKRSELHAFAVIPKCWVVERSFA